MFRAKNWYAPPLEAAVQTTIRVVQLLGCFGGSNDVKNNIASRSMQEEGTNHVACDTTSTPLTLTPVCMKWIHGSIRSILCSCRAEAQPQNSVSIQYPFRERSMGVSLAKVCQARFAPALPALGGQPQFCDRQERVGQPVGSVSCKTRDNMSHHRLSLLF